MIFESKIKDLIEQIVWLYIQEDQELILNGEPVEMTVPESYNTWDFQTPSGKLNYITADVEPLIQECLHGDNAPFWLINGNDIRILTLASSELMNLMILSWWNLCIHPEDAKMYNINDGAEKSINDCRQCKIKAYYDDEVSYREGHW